MTVTTQYQSFGDLGKNLLEQRGVKVTYGVFDPEVTGQGVDDGRVEETHEVNVLFKTGFRQRGSGTFTPMNEISAIMHQVPFDPKPGDYLITPQGKQYPITDVVVTSPDGVPLVYELRLTDG